MARECEMDVEGVVDEGGGGGVTVDPVDGATVGVAYRVFAFLPCFLALDR